MADAGYGGAGSANRISGLSRVIEYMFGRNALIGLASAMLLMISGYATWAGMHDFIIGVSASAGSEGRTTPGGFNVSHDNLVVAIVVALTFLMWLALRESFGAGRTWGERAITFPLYVFLALWSIGFGYGFWWSLIAGQEATRSGIAGLQEDARDAGSAISARLDAVRVQIDSVVSWSDGQMAREETSGGSCGVASGAGRGPLYNARRSVRDSVTTLRDGITKSWLGPVQDDLKVLQQVAESSDAGGVEERQRRFEARATEIRGRARSIATRSNELGKSTAAEMRALAAAVSVAPNQPGFSCFDATLAQRLRQAADQADQPANPRLREAAFNEGPAGTANAIKNLWQNMGSYTVSLVRYAFTGTPASDARTSGGEPITGRDMIALLATIGIDLGLLVLALLDPPKTRPDRQDGGRRAAENYQPVSDQTKRQLRSAIDTALLRTPGANLQWVHGHFIHHNGASYFVIPNLYRVDKTNAPEQQKAIAINQLAGVFSDLKLIRVMGEKDLKAAGKEEARASFTDLNTYREAFRKSADGGGGRDTADGKGAKPMRNHGLFSKAERALDIAGWSELAKSDVEVFRIVDVEGLTPLLEILTEARQAAAPPKDMKAAEPAAPKPLAIAGPSG